MCDWELFVEEMMLFYGLITQNMNTFSINLSVVVF